MPFVILALMVHKNNMLLWRVMIKQDTTRALQQSQIKWNDKNTSAAISYIYSRDR
jgi:hypothetical protein